MMCRRISPRLLPAFIIGMPKQTCCWIVQMLVIDEHLLCRFGVCVSAVAEHLTVANQEGKRHEHAVGPKLPGPAGDVRMPEAAVICARISVEDFANALCGQLVFFVFC